MLTAGFVDSRDGSTTLTENAYGLVLIVEYQGVVSELHQTEPLGLVVSQGGVNDGL
jgi:hypothetical protein